MGRSKIKILPTPHILRRLPLLCSILPFLSMASAFIPFTSRLRNSPLVRVYRRTMHPPTLSMREGMSFNSPPYTRNNNRPTSCGPSFRLFKTSAPLHANAGGTNNDDFVPISPATLNWEKIGPDQDVFISALSQNGQVNVKVISAKKMVQAIRDKRELSAVSTELLGRVMLSAMLVANGIKDEETLQLTFSGDGAAKGVMAISDGACNVRAWIGNSDLDDLKDPETGRADIKAAVGKGTLQVVKNHPSWRIPYNGVVQIASGEVAPDVAFYLASSEQRNTALGVGLSLDPKTGEVESAGGFYIEMMPGVEEESVLKVEVTVTFCVVIRTGPL